MTDAKGPGRVIHTHTSSSTHTHPPTHTHEINSDFKKNNGGTVRGCKLPKGRSDKSRQGLNRQSVEGTQNDLTINSQFDERKRIVVLEKFQSPVCRVLFKVIKDLFYSFTMTLYYRSTVIVGSGSLTSVLLL